MNAVLRALELNDRFQVLGIVVDPAHVAEFYGNLRPLLSKATKILVERMLSSDCEAADIRWVSSAEEAVARVLRYTVSLTLFDGIARSLHDVETFVSKLNGARDTMGETEAPSTLLLIIPARYMPEVSRTAKDLWSCAMVLRVPST